MSRRFDAVVDFDRYTLDDLVEIAERITEAMLSKFKFARSNVKLLRKIIKLMDPILMPGELKNIIKTSLAFSDSNNPYDYLRRIYTSLTDKDGVDFRELQNEGFTIREIELISGVSKSQVARELKENN